MCQKMEESDYRCSHINKGDDYHAKFSNVPYRRVHWNHEKMVLIGWMERHHEKGEGRYLDFACGTGRICGLLESYFNECYGVDVSASMLEVARHNVKKTILIQADITKNEIFNNKQFDLITAFRFFPNAQEILRREALIAIRSLLKDDGVFIFNNHKNERSILVRMLKLRHRNMQYVGMSHETVEQMVNDAGMTITETFHYGILPAPETWRRLPWGAIDLQERVLSRFQLFREFAQNIIYVCAKRVDK